MVGCIFVANGDITQFHAHALGYSASTYLGRDGNLYPAFSRNVPGFAEQYEALPRSCSIGDAFWIELPGDRPPYGVVVVAAAGSESGLGREGKVARAVRGAIDCAVEHLRPRAPAGERLLLALPTFRLGMGGDRYARLESARCQMDAAQEALIRHRGLDIVFVPYTTDSYRIFLQARRERSLAPPCPLDEPALNGLLEAFRERRCVLFAGAGLSAGSGLPGWHKLIESLAKELQVPCGSQPDLDYYLDLAQWYLERHGPEALGRILGGLFGGSETRPTLAHYLLLSLPLRVVLTTNYDTLLERTLAALRRHPIVVVDEIDVVQTGQKEGVSVVKLHGDAASQRGIVLARDDYDNYFRNHPAMALLLEGLLLNQTFLFVGYGLKDPNFRQMYTRIAAMLQNAKREAFALTVSSATNATPLLAEQWRKKGLHLLEMPGELLEERIHASLRLLDCLADRLSTQDATLFLARDVPTSRALFPLRDQFINGVGPILEESCYQTLSPTEARSLADVLGFLTDHGWRPNPRSGNQLWRLWANLAGQTPDLAEKRRLLIRALRETERSDHTEVIQQALADLTQETDAS